ncbi:Kinesin light chain [Stylophora pistillata]|uniref:Kinesin light chain n=2 Tax=Stylophora pistillata TaxID=50429 RepID=A0A2B4S9M4_STYPI|nr:Kinesin light chain [Stylophora pistillata]
MRLIPNWRRLASKLKVDSDDIRRLEQYHHFSPTIRLFEYLEQNQPDLTMRHLKDAFLEIKRNDLFGSLTTEASFDDSEKVKDVIKAGLLDEIALALDGSSLILSNWKTLAVSLGVSREACRELERQSMESPTGKLFQYLATSVPEMKLSSLKEALRSVERKDLINFLQEQNIGDDELLKNVIIPGSELYEKMTQELNCEGPCIKNWTHVASKLEIPSDVYQNFADFKQTRKSPTKEILEWVAARFPEKTLSDVAKALDEIQRNDAIQIISKHYPVTVDSALEQLSCSFQENFTMPDPTGQVLHTGHKRAEHGSRLSQDVEVKKGLGCYRGLPDRTILVGRDDVCEDIVNALSSEKAVEIFAPPGYGKTSVVIEVAHRMIEGGKFVAYVKPRGFNCVEDLASKIVEAFGFFPGENPISEVFHSISSMKRKNGLLIIENIDNLLHLEDQVSNYDYHQELKSKNYFKKTCGKYTKNDFLTFLKDIGQTSKIQLILTSRETYHFSSYFPTKLIDLKPLNEEDSASMFTKCDESLDDDVIGDLVRVSGGIPRLICTLISTLIKENPQMLAQRLSTSSPSALVKELSPDFLADEDRIDKCLEICFDRLSKENQKILVVTSAFPYRFTKEQFENVFGSSVVDDLQTCLNCLKQKSLLHYDKRSCQYFFDRFIRDFYSLKPDHVEAKSTFIRHYSYLAVTLCETFLTKDCKSAIDQYRSEKDNIREAMTCCGDDHSELDQSVRERCIKALNKAAVFLAKVMRKQEFQSLFCKLAYLCRSHMHLYSACLTNIGMKIVASCTCTPHICSRALSQAKEILIEANDIHSTLTNVKDTTRAQCLSKLGFCYVREGRIAEGYGYLNNALKLRKKRTEELKKGKDHVMLAACYNDLAASQMVQRNHMLAISTRVVNVLPVYEKILGDHPFTATTLNWIGNSYHALGNYDNAIRYNRISLSIRKQMLGEHQETARSLYDLGVAYSAKEKYETALKFLEKAVNLQEKVLDTQDELIHTHQAMSIALRGLGRTKEAEEEMNRARESAKKADSLQSPLDKLKTQERG